MSKAKRKVSIASILKENIANQERLLAEMTTDLKKDREFVFPTVPHSLRKFTFRIDIYSSWEGEGEHSVHLEETKPLEQVLALAAKKFMEVNNRSDVQGHWNLSVVLPSGRVVRVHEEQWGHLKEFPIAKKVFHHDDPPCKERLVTKGRGNYCPTCRLHPDMQSLQIKWYCPTCDIPLKDLQCPKCHLGYTIPK